MAIDADAVIIGGGIGGVTVGALLAHGGMKVKLLERNPFLGGRCVGYEKEGFIIDVFVHMFGRCEKGPFGEILKSVGRPDAIKWWHASKDSRPLFYIDEDPYPYPDPSFSTSEEIAQVYRAYGLSDEEMQDLYNIWDAIVNLPYEETFELDDVPYSHWLKKITSNKAILALEHQKTLLYSVVTSREASTGEMIRMIRNAYRDANIGYPYGGCSVIPNTFGDIIHDLGGEVMLECPVRKILIYNNKVEGVLLEDGTRILSPMVISNAGIKETVFKYVGEELLPEDYVKQIERLTTGKLVEETPMGMVYLKLALDKPIIESPLILRNVKEGAMEGSFEIMQALIEDKPPQSYRGINSFIPVPSNMDPKLAPPGMQLVNFYGLAPINTDNLDAWIDYHLGDLYRLYPEVKDHLMWTDVSTLSRINKYSGRFYSDIIGIVQSVGQSGKSRPSPVTPVENLYLVGADVGQHNIGTELAAESAIRVAGMIL